MPYPADRRSPQAQAIWSDLPPAQPIPFAAAGNQSIISRPGLLVGWSTLNNDAANGHQISFLDGTDAGGTFVAASKPAANQGVDTQSPSPPGLLCERGVYMVDASGHVSGAIWYVPL